MAIPAIPLASADVGCPVGAIACCTVGATCNIAGGCGLGTTKVAHGHAGGAGVASVSLECALGGNTNLVAVSCTGTGECIASMSTPLGGNMRCVAANPGGSGYCAIFP